MSTSALMSTGVKLLMNGTVVGEVKAIGFGIKAEMVEVTDLAKLFKTFKPGLKTLEPIKIQSFLITNEATGSALQDALDAGTEGIKFHVDFSGIVPTGRNLFSVEGFVAEFNGDVKVGDAVASTYTICPVAPDSAISTTTCWSNKTP